jgi:hypothetical protein
MTPKLMLLHIVLMALAAVLILTAAGLARGKKENWFPRHRILALLGTLSALLAFTSIFISKTTAGYSHFKSLHALAGALGLVLLVVTPIVGMLLASGKSGLRPLHRMLGRITSFIVLFAALIGILRLLRIFKK